jgi:hypothetical protein
MGHGGMEMNKGKWTWKNGNEQRKMDVEEWK